MNTQNYAVNIRVGLANAVRVNISQGDTGRTLAFSLYDGLSPFTPPTGSTVTIVGRKPSKLGFRETCTVSGNVATVATTLAMTQEAGKFPAELRIEAGGQSIGTANFTMYVEPSPHPDGTTDGTTEEARTVLAQCEEYAQIAQEAAEAAEDVVQDAVDEWLDEHPEATTTVQDNAVTTPKIKDGAVTTPKIKDGAVETKKIENSTLLVHMVKGTNANSSINWFGDCIVIHGSANGLIDFGADPDGASLIQYLLQNGIVKLGFCIISHYHSDHISSDFANLISEIISAGIDLSDCIFYLPHKGIDWSRGNFTETPNENAVKSVLDANMISYVEPNDGDEIDLTSDLSIQFFNIGSRYYENYYDYYIDEIGGVSDHTIYNNFSMIAVLKHYEHSFVFTGDIHYPAQKANVSNIESCDVYKVEHHALNKTTQSQWLGKINPKFAMIGNYSNNYNDELLTRQTVAKLVNSGCTLMSTADSSITLVSDRHSIKCVEGIPYNVRNLQNGSIYYEGEPLIKEHFSDSVLTNGLINVDKLMIPGKYYSSNAALSTANIVPFTVDNFDFSTRGFQLEIQRGSDAATSVIQKLVQLYYNSTVAIRKYNLQSSRWGDWVIFTDESYKEYHAYDDLGTFIAPSVYANRVQYVAGGYKNIGTKTYVDIIAKTVSGYTFGAGSFTVFNQLPYSKDYPSPLTICAITSDKNVSKFLTANVGTTGGLSIATSDTLGTPNTQTTIRIKGWYYHS